MKIDGLSVGDTVRVTRKDGSTRTVRVTGTDGQGFPIVETLRVTPPKKPKKLDAKHCRGCTDDFYNGHNPLGVQECWGRATAVLTLRRRVHIDERPPWTARPEKLPSCYKTRGYVFVDPKTSR